MESFCQSVSYIQFSCDMQLSNLADRQIISNVAVFNWVTNETTGRHTLYNRKGQVVVVVESDGSAEIYLNVTPFMDFKRVEFFLSRAGIMFKHR